MQLQLFCGSKSKIIQANKNQTLADVISDSGCHHLKPCGGNGTCGKCRVSAKGNLSKPSQQEKKLLGEELLSQGIRLSCMATVLGDCSVWISESKDSILEDGSILPGTLNPMGSKFGFAIDIGTTTVAVRLYELNSGNLTGKDAFMNPQGTFGADVISRIQFALGGDKLQLQQAIAEALDRSMSKVCVKAGITENSVDACVVTGNTTMLYLLSGKDTSPLSCSPFLIEDFLGTAVPAETLGIRSFPTLDCYLPRTISAFVGSDITCALLACLGSGQVPQQPTLLADMGTNGEMAVFYKDKLICCSTAMGPAFEGAGITMGMMAAQGAVNRVWLEGETICCSTIGNISARGICGSGLIDAVSVLMRTGLLDESGFLAEESERYSRHLTDYEGDTAVILGEGILITQKDIRAVQLAKSAFCAGILSLLNEASLASGEISCLYLAGGFGNFLNIENAAQIGLIPKELSGKTKSIGNAALSGAVSLLLEQNNTERCNALSRQAELIDLSTSPFFMDQYVSGMSFEI